ncbi:MAG TPA: 6,7-dimethyl-8-ribityllumazine synthase [Actinomycetota bacterium]|nr:6,7-dimethyl-8-ribityllumazine synthase [Actinomycetota bacterium]
MKILEGERKGKGLRIGIIASRFNIEVTEALVEGALKGLGEVGVARRSTTVVWVPGAIELPGTAAVLAASGKYDALVAIGAVIQGETEHFTYVCKAAQEGILRASMDSGIPITFGVLTTNNAEQALDRAGGAYGNKGYEAALDAVEMANLYKVIG